jgi:hypothetical protein
LDEQLETCADGLLSNQIRGLTQGDGAAAIGLTVKLLRASIAPNVFREIVPSGRFQSARLLDAEG